MCCLLIGLTGGCAGLSRAPEAVPDPPPDLLDAPDSAVARLNPDVLYYVGAAEISGRAEQHQRAAQFYLKAAELADDPKIAERAVQLAVYADDEALTLRGINRWLELEPDAPEPQRLAAVVRLRQGDTDRAWEHVSKLLERSNGPETWDAIIKVLAGSKGRAAATEVYRRLAAEHNPPAVEEIVQRLSDLGAQFAQLVLAEQFATRALQLNPGNAQTYNWRGRLRTSLNRLDDALADFAEAVELDPENAPLRQSYAALLAEVGDYYAAIEQLDQVEPSAMVIYSQGVYAMAAEDEALANAFYEELKTVVTEDENEKYFFLGQLAETLKRPYSEVIDWYGRVRSGERMEDARLRTALVLGTNDELPQARVILRRLQNGTAQTAARAYLAEAGLLRQADMNDEAYAVYSQGLELLPANTELLFARALLAEEMDLVEVTEKDLQQILETDPDDPNALNALGYTLADRTDRYAEALSLIERALEQLPDEAAVVDSMGWVQYKLGNLELALDYLERALSLDYDAEIVAHLGEVLWALGRHDEARETWRQGLEKNPDSEIIRLTRERFVKD